MAAGFTDPTPIQRQAATALLAGRELLAIAPTGSGKTLAFLLPLVMRVRELKQAAEEAAAKAAEAAAAAKAAAAAAAAIAMGVAATAAAAACSTAAGLRPTC